MITADHPPSPGKTDISTLRTIIDIRTCRQWPGNRASVLQEMTNLVSAITLLDIMQCDIWFLGLPSRQKNELSHPQQVLIKEWKTSACSGLSVQEAKSKACKSELVNAYSFTIQNSPQAHAFVPKIVYFSHHLSSICVSYYILLLIK